MTDSGELRLLYLLSSNALRNEDMDGEWEAPHISNPACQIGCGEWKPPMIDNPKYKGVWRPPMIDNPNYQVRTTCFNPILESKCYASSIILVPWCTDSCTLKANYLEGGQRGRTGRDSGAAALRASVE